LRLLGWVEHSLSATKHLVQRLFFVSPFQMMVRNISSRLGKYL
jgi:hypothetical protein